MNPESRKSKGAGGFNSHPNSSHSGMRAESHHTEPATSSSSHSQSGDSRSPALVPPGVLAIYHACSTIYKNQPNPLQVTAVRKYWLDGPDPLDYISMYENEGDESRHIPPHWHYVSLGLSDLHGDGRVHERGSPEDGSGYGFELTFRLKRDGDESAPPTWPAVLMQALARYVFQSDNILQGGDHVSWHSPLDRSESRIQHMLMAEDAQLSPTHSHFGYVNFIQIVGVCTEELKAAQHWNGPGILELLRNISSAGGPWLITDMKRGKTIFELDPSFQDKLEQGIEQEGSNLSGVSGLIQWEEGDCGREVEVHERLPHHHHHGNNGTPHLSATDTEKIKSMLQKGLRSSHHQPQHLEGSDQEPASADTHSKRNVAGVRQQSTDSNGDHPAAELVRSKTLSSLHLKFNAETGSLLPLALRGRLRHGRHFTFKSTLNESTVTLVPPTVVGAIADDEHRFAVHGMWLQVLLDDDFISQLAQQLDFLSDLSQVVKPEVFHWPEHRLSISILPDPMIGLSRSSL